MSALPGPHGGSGSACTAALLARCELDKHGSGLRIHILAINHLVDQFAARANQPTNQPTVTSTARVESQHARTVSHVQGI